MNHESYFIPANFTDAGRVFGLFELRNVVEAVALGLPVLFLCLRLLPFALTTNIIVTLIIFVPVFGFALMGLSDDSLSRFLKSWWRWRNRRRILTFRGGKSA